MKFHKVYVNEALGYWKDYNTNCLEYGLTESGIGTYCNMIVGWDISLDNSLSKELIAYMHNLETRFLCRN